MGLKNVIEEFFSTEAGQERRAWLSGKEEQFGNALNYALGPDLAPRVNALANVGAMISPGADVMEARQAGRDMFAPDRSALDRAGSAAAMVGAGAMMLMPGGASSVRQGVESVVDAGMRAYDPTVVGSNAANATPQSPAQTVDGLLRSDRVGPARVGDNQVKVGDTRVGYSLGSDGVAEIYSVRTPVAKRGGGSARAAVESVISDLEGSGVASIRILPSPLDNRTSSARLAGFYESLGFSRTGETANLAGDEWMTKEISANSAAPSSPAQTVASMLREGRGAEVTDEMYAAADPTELHRLYTEGATGADMPMDTPSRMARADGMGFGADRYHATDKDIDAFKTGDVSGLQGRGVYVAPGARDAEGFIRLDEDNLFPEGANVIPVRTSGGMFDIGAAHRTRPDTPEGMELLRRFGLREKRDYGDDGIGGQIYDSAERRATKLEPPYTENWLAEINSGLTRKAERAGYSGSVDDYTGFEKVFDPANVRSQFARFDPRLAQLSNLSAGVAGAGAVGIAAQQRQPEQRRELPPLAPELAFMKDIYR